MCRREDDDGTKWRPQQEDRADLGEPLWDRTHKTLEVEDFVVSVLILETLGLCLIKVILESHVKGAVWGQEQAVWSYGNSHEFIGGGNACTQEGLTAACVENEQIFFILAASESRIEEPAASLASQGRGLPRGLKAPG